MTQWFKELISNEMIRFTSAEKIIFVLLLFFCSYNIASGYSDSTKTLGSTAGNNNLSLDSSDKSRNKLQIDTGGILIKTDSVIIKDSTRTKDSVKFEYPEKTGLTNTELLIYIVLTAGGLYLFFFIFVQSLFRSFHKKFSTRQSMALSWSLFSLVSIIWIFIIWGIVAKLWISAAFMTVIVFLFIVSLILLVIAIKSK